MNQVQQFFEYLFKSFKIWVIVQPWEAGIRVRNGNYIKKLNKGIYFKIPYFDSVFVQEIRLRVVEMPMQTLTSKDKKTITLNSSIGYSIKNIEKLYQSLYKPEMTLQNIAMSTIAEVLSKEESDNVTPDFLENRVIEQLKNEDYGLEFEYFKITNFAIVRTYRLIQDQSWVSEGYSMDEKR